MSDTIIERAVDTVAADIQETAGGLTAYLDPLRIPPTLRPGPDAAREGIVVNLSATWCRLHSQMPPTHVWAYDGHFPGPTFEVRRGQRVRVAWTNRITGDYPVSAVEAPVRPGQAPPSTEPGRGADAVPVQEVDDLPAWTVTHLHGAVTGGGNDGWAENAVAYGDAQLAEYPNDHRATSWWYHDHAMDITRWNVYSGLVGVYLIRDEEEDALHLPRGRYEVPLVLTDRNFETDSENRLTGRLLHKTVSIGVSPESGKQVTIPFTGPYTLVNGVVWPHLEVEPRWYRFRLLNASNARIYDLALIDEDGGLVSGAVKQIGSDGGLLPYPVDVDFDGALSRLTIAPAERMDLLVDFSRLRGRDVRLVNVGSKAPGEADPLANVAFPQVMKFRVGGDPVHDRFVLPSVLSSSFRRYAHDMPHGHRLVVLTPPGTTGGAGHPEIWEMEQVDDGSVPVPSDGVIQLADKDGATTTYRRISRTFDDGLGFKLSHGDYEIWSFLNLGGPTHPMHIHLTDFQLMGRDPYTTAGFDPGLGGTRTPVVQDADPAHSIVLEPNEQGWKDVFRVPASQILRVMGRFTGAYGRFMYHCHLLEHEDMGMMRPFVVMPPQALKFDHHQPGHGGH